MPIKNALHKFTLASLLAASTLLAQTPYDEGQKALREQRWTDAADQFELVIDADSEQADAALYWKAYAYYKAGRRNEAERELRKLERAYPDSRWVKEARTLRVEYQDAAETIEAVAADGSLMDEELRLFALSQLMERDPERALPLVLDLMNNAHSEQVRNDAMFVLGMSEQPAARQALARAAQDANDPETQIDAIHMLGNLDASEELQSLYPTLQTSEAKVAVIEALSIQGDSAVLIRYLENEQDPAVRKAAIYGLAMEGDSESMQVLESMYESSTSTEEKVAILESLTLMDDAEGLALRILRTETDPRLKRQAIQMLGVMDATGELADLYASVDGQETRADVIEALTIAEDTEGLYNILRLEQDTELRAAAIQGLAVTESPGAVDYLLGIYPNASPEEKGAVIESMMIMENSKALLGLLEQETDPELKRRMLQMLAAIDSGESDDYLFRMLEKPN